MDKEQRGPLLADQEVAQQKIDEIRSRLTEIAQNLKRLSDALILEPENIAFPDAPGDLKNIPAHRTDFHTFNWDKLPNFKEIAQLTCDLRHEKDHLSDIERGLKDPNRI
jgi:hypothetical protein